MENTDKVKILFCNIGWMKKYEGERDDDRRPEGGGSHNIENIGFEACNFREIGSQVYGYVQNVNNPTTINLERITKKKEDEKNKFISGVTVIWTATNPYSNDGRVVVGWYKNATVYHCTKESPIQWRKDKDACYNISASASDVTLLPINKRTLSLPKGKHCMARNVWYADVDTPEIKKFVSKAIKLVNERNEVPDLDRAVNEGGRRSGTHFYIERNPKLVKAKKDEILKKFGKLCCEVCGFDFAATYGELGKGYCEAHHSKKQLSEYDGKEKTKPEDLAIVCSNCHRIIHRKKKMLDIKKLEKKYKEIAKARGA